MRETGPMEFANGQDITQPVDLAFVSLWTPNIVDWCAEFNANKKRYCEAWGLAFHGYDRVLDESRPAVWSKIPALEAHIGEHDWLFWVDADAVVANFAFDLRTLCSPAFDLIITHDSNGFNAGTFLIRNSPESREFLGRVWERDIRDRFLEQSAMAEIMAEMQELKVRLLPKRMLNSYWDDYEPGDFIFHAPGESSDTKRKLLRVVAKATDPERLGTFHDGKNSDRIRGDSPHAPSADGLEPAHHLNGNSSTNGVLSLPPIEMTIWQTYRSRDALPDASFPLLASWRERNPDWKMEFQDDRAIREFFENHLPGYLDLFDALPLGVMKADLWRYGVISVHGGLYADIDTRCNAGLSEWLDSGRNRELHLACENNHPFFCQWAFAAPAGHPVLQGVLELIAQRIGEDGGVDRSRPDFVHYYTGPGVWTAAVQKYLECPLLPAEIYENREIWEHKGIRIYQEGEFTWGRISHANASHQWGGADYPSWRSE